LIHTVIGALLSPKIFSLNEDSVLKMSIRLIDILRGLSRGLSRGALGLLGVAERTGRIRLVKAFRVALSIWLVGN